MDTEFKSFSLYKKSKKIIPGGVNSPVRAYEPYPFFASHAKGSKIYDVDGKAYIDYCLAYGPLILGHGYQEIIESTKKQLDKGTLYGTPTEMELELAEMICSNVPSIEMVRLVNTGTEATMSAIRTARGYMKMDKIVKFAGCYHGAHDSVLVKAGSGASTHGSPDSLGIPQETTQNTIVLPFNDVEALDETLANNDEIAAVILEPVIGNAGVILPKKGFLRKLRKLTKDYNTLLIFDEVITGFRLAFGGAQEYFGVNPDMTTLGKVMGGGFPIGAYGGRKDIMETVAPLGKVYQAGTFSGNPISVNAGLSTLKVLKKKGKSFYNEMEKKKEFLVSSIIDSSLENGLQFQVNSIASMFQIFFTKTPVSDYKSAKKADIKTFMHMQRELLKEGVFIAPSQFETCFISQAHSENDLTKTANIYERVLKKVSKSSG